MGGAQTELDVAGHAEQDVVALDVPVNDLVRMQELQPTQHLPSFMNVPPPALPTSREMAAIWPSLSTVSVTTSVSEPPAR